MQHEFPGYHVTQQLYLSARSSVERVVRSDDGAAVVLKQPGGAVITAEALRRVQHEYALLVSLSGPGVVRAHAVVRDAGCAGSCSRTPAGRSPSGWPIVGSRSPRWWTSG